MDLEAFEERAAIMEFDGGLSRFEAETLAAQAQGYQRHEVMNEIRKRNSEQARHHGSSAGRVAADAMPRVQPWQAQEGGPVSERDVQAGRAGLALLAL